QGLRVLVADDNPDVQFAIVLFLERLGCEVSVADDGAQAVRVASEQALDVILMDLQMPRLDGLEATRKLRASGLRTPILAVTADAMDEHRAECLAAGCNDHIAKPFDLELLEAKLLALRQPG